MQKNSATRASYDGEIQKPPKESDFLPTLGNKIENKTPHGRNHKEAETMPIKTVNKIKKNELAASLLDDDEFNLDDF